jgi:hypothetical protein
MVWHMTGTIVVARGAADLVSFVAGLLRAFHMHNYAPLKNRPVETEEWPHIGIPSELHNAGRVKGYSKL